TLPPRPTRFPYTTLFRSPAVGHCGTCEFCPFRRTPLAHRRVDGCRPRVHAFGVGVSDDDAAHRRCRSVDVLLVDAVVRSHALLRSEEHTSELQSLAYLVC